MKILTQTGLIVALVLQGLVSPVLADDNGASAPTVSIFSIDFCPSCMAAKQHFENKGITYREFNIQQSPEAHDVFTRMGGRGIPFIVINGKTMNGFHPERFDRLWEEVSQP